MIAIAVPQFVSLLLVRNFFADSGIVNTICKNLRLTDGLFSLDAVPTPNCIPFLTHPSRARVMIILITMWVGIPYQMLIATGILMNIPTELLESACIDGANAWQSFKSITMPYLIAKGFFDTISKSLRETAMLKGANEFTIFRKIIIECLKMITVKGPAFQSTKSGSFDGMSTRR